MTAKKKSPKSICPITKSESVRAKAAMQVDTIRHAFPKGISAPALRALYAANFMDLGSLTKVTEAELLQLHGMGPKAIATLKSALQEHGLSFAE